MNRTKASQGASELTRVLARKDVLALAFGAMVGWGWIVMTGNWIQSAGSMGAILAFLIGGVAIVLVGLTYAELASAMPQVGGSMCTAIMRWGISLPFCVPGPSCSAT